MSTILSFRAKAALAEEVENLANFLQMKKSEYLEQAVREKNERVLAQRLAFLSRQLSKESEKFCKSADGSIGDGLA